MKVAVGPPPQPCATSAVTCQPAQPGYVYRDDHAVFQFNACVLAIVVVFAWWVTCLLHECKAR